MYFSKKGTVSKGRVSRHPGHPPWIRPWSFICITETVISVKFVYVRWRLLTLWEHVVVTVIGIRVVRLVEIQRKRCMITIMKYVVYVSRCAKYRKQPKTANQKDKLLPLTSQTKLTENNRKQTENNLLVVGCFRCLASWSPAIEELMSVSMCTWSSSHQLFNYAWLNVAHINK